MNPIYPAHCVPCLAKRECPSLPHSINCDLLRRVEDVGQSTFMKPDCPVVEAKPCTK